VKVPISVLQRAVQKHISIFLKDGLEYRSRMVNVDPYMNIVLQDAEEYSFDTLTANFGTVVIRGSNILLIKLQDEL
jgi:small nuclear ribonucleoprotein